MAAVLVSVTIFRVWFKGGILPPHEFAYGMTLRTSGEIPQRMDQFLSLEEIDPNQIQIQTYVGNRSEKNLKPLLTYISSQRKDILSPLLAELENIDRLPDQKEKAIQLVRALLPYKDSLRNESQQDTIIVFVYYGLKQPSNLSQTDKAEVSELVRQSDTATQSAAFDSGNCPNNYLLGNINIYPLALDNTSWHSSVELPTPKDAPILEIRFMGLKGIFRYLLDEMTRKTGTSFAHLDGESL